MQFLEESSTDSLSPRKKNNDSVPSDQSNSKSTTISMDAPEKHNKQVPNHHHHLPTWFDVGEKVELRPLDGSQWSDFGTIIGINENETYNVKITHTQGYRKFVPPQDILGSGNDRLDTSFWSSSEESESNDEDSDWEEAVE